MRGYAVHLLFHILAAVIGGVCGLTAALWWFGTMPMAATMFFGALLLGVVLLAIQAFYIRVTRPRAVETTPPPSSERSRHPDSGATHRSPTGTRPELPTRSHPGRW